MPVPPPLVAEQDDVDTDGPIEVRAKRLGFYDNERKMVGDVFTVPSMDMVGNWMECVDPELEKIHQEMMVERKRKLKASGQ